MNTPTRVTAFVIGVAAVFAAAAGIGTAVGPLDDTAAATDAMGDHGGDAGAGHNESGHGTGASGVEELPGGLMVSQSGYTLDLEQSHVRPARSVPLRFRILGPEGEPVTSYTKEHGKDLHLIVVRRDMAGYQHVHPTLGSDGTWAVDLDLPTAGEYRVFADFAPAGAEGITLGADLAVEGTYEPHTLPEPTGSTQVGDYTVTLDGKLAVGESSPLTLLVSRNGEPVTDLQPYLEAYGHLVALRDGDLAYLHVHPDGAPDDGETRPGPKIRFFAEVPSTGSYRLFLDFKHGDEVRTAEFTMNAGAGTQSRSGEHGKSQHGHGH
ncbi:hypothetical protein [Solicola gregarius]|uniref:Secreted protein n=1 Tax=Solicola gregarius TaxID=2908642 RepID=A0AA46TLI1_9ACTN|nr:hypothetical protein [Solicola gregarius]UYM07127.1 hypothetical protein L0C25_08635 [Solicola gregarius]